MNTRQNNGLNMEKYVATLTLKALPPQVVGNLFAKVFPYNWDMEDFTNHASQILAEPMRKYWIRKVSEARSLTELDTLMYTVDAGRWREYAKHVLGPKAKLIASRAKAAIASPHTQLGKRRLQREFEGLAGVSKRRS